MELTIPQIVAAPLFDIQCKKWKLLTLTFNKYIIFFGGNTNINISSFWYNNNFLFLTKKLTHRQCFHPF
jgi:hypothetical protein